MSTASSTAPPAPLLPRRGLPALWHWFLGILFRRTTLVLSLLLCVGGGLVFWHFSRLSSELIRSSALQSAPDYSRILTETRAFYTSDVAGRALGHGVDVTPDYKAKPGSIPIPTTFTLELGERLSANDKGVKVRLYSSLPFPQRRKTGGPRDAYERDALKYLTANPGRSFVRFEKYKGRDSIRYSTADIMLPACVSCHNTRADSPKKDWKVGDVRGVLEVVRPLDKVVAQTNEGLRGTFALMSALSIAALGALSLVVGKLRRNSNELEGRVLARTQDLSRANEMLQSNIAERARVQEQLRAAKEEAEDANRSKSAFLATMSHEIRTPMNAVIGMSGLLLSTPLNAEQKEFAGLIEHSGDALLGIINDILDFSKIEAGRMDLECHALDFNDCIESAFDLVAVRAGEKGIELVHDFDAEAAPPDAILGDSTRLRQVLTNLLSNAVKFTESGEIVLTARARRLDAEEAAHAPATACDLKTGGEHTDAPQNPRYELHFSVRDTGIGIASDRMDRLFKSFSQVDASTTRKYGGSGLGLTISKRLCEMMGGTMWAESEGEGRGSTFHCTVCAEAASLPPRRHRQAGALPQLQGKRVSKPVRAPELIAALAQCRALSPEAPIQEPRNESPPRLALPEEQPILDGNSLRRLREAMGEDFLPELIETYLADSEVLVEEMLRAVPSGDAEALRRAAHTLKSNSATFGALGLASMCKYLEEHGLSEAADETGERVAQIEAEHEKVRTALKALEQRL